MDVSNKMDEAFAFFRRENWKISIRGLHPLYTSIFDAFAAGYNGNLVSRRLYTRGRRGTWRVAGRGFDSISTTLNKGGLWKQVAEKGVGQNGGACRGFLALRGMQSIEPLSVWSEFSQLLLIPYLLQASLSELCSGVCVCRLGFQDFMLLHFNVEQLETLLFRAIQLTHLPTHVYT